MSLITKKKKPIDLCGIFEGNISKDGNQSINRRENWSLQNCIKGKGVLPQVERRKYKK